MPIRISDEELAVLGAWGLSNEARTLYVLCLRRRADYDTGIVGDKKGATVSMQEMKETVEVRRKRGSHKPDYIPNIEAMRWIQEELEAAGLVERLPKKRRTDPPRFRLPLMSVGSSVYGEEPQRNPKGATPKENTEETVVSGPWNPKGTPKEEPHTTGDRKDTSPNGEVVGGSADACPHQRIIQAYHEELPMCPPVRQWHKTRQAYLRARWREDPKRQDVEWWRKFFRRIRETCPFLIGGVEPRDGGRPFVADLEWIVRPSNFAKIMEGRYAA